MMRNAYVQSQYDRNPDDHYPTIDERCVIAINATWDIPTPCIDPFHNGEPTPLYPAVNGQLRDLLGAPNAILTNPPYKRGLVDELMGQCISLVKDGVIDFCAALLRVQWDTAVTRQWMMEPPFAGKTILTFRPWWTAPEDRTAHPIHNYQWLVWDRRHNGEPVVRYHNGGNDE